MSEFKGTPGPWSYHREGFSTVYIEARLRQGVIQEVAACGPTEAGQEQQLSNAKLIAAAPDLLEALQRLKAEIILSDVDMDYIESHFRPWLDKARSAISKATGE